MLIGGGATAAGAAFVYLLSMAKNINGKENRGYKIKLIATAIAILLVVMALFIYFISSVSPKSRDMCINCGKNPVFNQYGYCYECEKSLKEFYSEQS